MKKLTKKQELFLTILEKSPFNIAEACRKANISRKSYYDWINKSDTFKQKAEDIQNSIIDFAETSLLRQIKEGNTVATIFFLKTKGKKRGYVEKVETEEVGDNVVTHLWIPDNGRRGKKD